MHTRRLTAHELHEAAALITAGQPVAMPTETVYGLAAIAFDAEAVARVFAAKERPAHDPLICHVSPRLLGDDVVAGLQSIGLVGPLTVDARLTLQALTDRWWPGPLTLVLPRGQAVPDAVTSGLPTVAIRMPAHPVALGLIDAVGQPLVAPSANRFGRISPTTAEAVHEELHGRIAAIVDGGPCSVGVESTVLGVHEHGGVTLFRPGRVSRHDVEDLLGGPAKTC